MKYLFCILIATATYGVYFSWTYQPTAACDEAALDRHSAEIGAYEITCEELGDL